MDDSQGNAQPTNIPITYTRRQGTCGLGGQMYEITLAMLFLLQGSKLKQAGSVKNFWLAANMDDAGAFDDVVFKSNKKDTRGINKSTIVFLQAKHSEASTKKINFFAPSSKYVTLQKYFDSYVDIKQKLINHPFFTNFHDAEFIYFTNACLPDHTEKFYVTRDVDVNSVWDLQPNNCFYQFNFDQLNELDNIVDTFNRSSLHAPVDKDEVQEFLSKFKIFTGQPNVNGLCEIIKAKLQSMYNLNEGDIESIFKTAKDNVENWWKEGNYFLTELNDFFLEAKLNHSKLKLDGYTLSAIKKIKKHGLELNVSKLDIFKDAIRKHKILNIVTNKTTLLINQTVLYQALEFMDEYKSGDTDLRYIFLSSNDALNLKPIVIDAFKTKECNLIAIECDTNDVNLDLTDQLSLIISDHKYQNKRLVLLADSSNRFGNNKEISQFNFGFNDLTGKSQKEILDKGIKFQGKPVQLKEIIKDPVTYVLAAEELSLLINNENINIGKAPTALGEIDNVYIERIVEIRKTIDKECFKDRNVPDWFAFSSIEERELSILTGSQQVRKFTNNDRNVKDSKFIILDNESSNVEDFQHLCSVSSKNIHWLKQQGNELIWLKTRGALSNIRKFFNSNIVEEIQTDAIQDRIVILAAEPGMGKSTLITKLMQSRDNDVSCWVIRINLGEHTDKLNSNDFNAINFLSDAAGLTTSLEKSLLHLSLNKQGNIIIYVDGFDEISPTYKDKVLQLLTVLQGTKAKRIFVATREHMSSTLEDGLSLLSYRLKPLTRKEQILEFLYKETGYHTP